jgi:hypothetical protein
MSGPLGAGTVISSLPWMGISDSGVRGPQWGKSLWVNSAQLFAGTDPLGCRQVSLGSNMFHRHRAGRQVNDSSEMIGPRTITTST